jgi:hypothetical protein
MDLLTITEELKDVDYTVDGSVTFKFLSGDMGSGSDEDMIAFAMSKFKDVNMLLKCLLILNYYQNAEVEKTAVAVNVTVDNWVTKNGPS